MRVLETDQWTAMSVIFERAELKLSDFEKPNAFESLIAGDAASAKKIFGGTCRIMEVNENQSPGVGHVWFNEVDGKLQLWKSNYDSSD